MARHRDGRSGRTPWFRVAVAGDSMLPALTAGDWLLCRRVAPAHPVSPGDLVIVEQPDRWGFFLVKRAIRREGEGWWVEGDNAGASDDSRTFGIVPDDLVVARAVARLLPRPTRL